eukprot:TRINITY_DN11380_c0_g1_i1.p2 TRINITY_DN11380_c0_g1~~TRINITY_DN11380_c0_g1_i1.p2  ORF type:complete len:124 (+),score=3.16 TRINITY_DN11380_c0_g1_i1:146-517(+)
MQEAHPNIVRQSKACYVDENSNTLFFQRLTNFWWVRAQTTPQNQIDAFAFFQWEDPVNMFTEMQNCRSRNVTVSVHKLFIVLPGLAFPGARLLWEFMEIHICSFECPAKANIESDIRGTSKFQ